MESSAMNPILDYIQKLPLYKKGLPCGQPVCVMVSHHITHTADLIQLAAELGPHIAVFQVQADFIEDWSQDTIDQLTYQAKKHAFILWESSRVLNVTVSVMGRGYPQQGTCSALGDMIRTKYTNGLIKPAAWAGMATCWAAGVPYDQQEKDLLIPSLRKAARQAVATTVKTIQTEISAEQSEPTPEEPKPSLSPPSTNGWPEFSNDNMGYALRKSSTISVTESVTMQPHVQPDDGIPPPPLLARGMALLLPGSINTAFTPEYRQSTLAATCANADFVIGITTSEPFFHNYRGNTLLELASEDGHGSYTSDGDCFLRYSPYMDMDMSLGLFSLIPPDLMHDYDDDLARTVNGDSSHESQSPCAAKLYYMIDRAMKLRDANRKEHGTVYEPTDLTGPTMYHVPIVVLP
ncbi:uncharacterized protein N7483_006625 [Penicillium malachiteum]|uniref:uncharacterized protein n=1 Tax=Penicillium malachiteum TaxID=1324776 RepID=UPI0025496C17|nr:uncharacterized protein N7483_006625 [Penicillium malachiteum]KAJ5725268.1 hypothetical protein N7483_006625 [Penicillium malachiteum]